MITLTEGKFGEAVGNIIEAQTGAPQMPLRVALGEIARVVSQKNFVAVTSWRRADRELDELDEACFAAGVPWCSAYPIEDRLACGPLVIPGTGPCYRCFRRRYLCHHPAPEREISLQRAYARDATLGSPGFAAPVAWMAASMLLAAADVDRNKAGQLLEVSLFDFRLLDTRVVAVHNCSRCNPRIQTRTGDRFVDRLIPSVEDLLS